MNWMWLMFDLLTIVFVFGAWQNQHYRTHRMFTSTNLADAKDNFIEGMLQFQIFSALAFVCGILGTVFTFIRLSQ